MKIVCGIDEVGRGAWCGPVVAAAMMFRPGPEGEALRARVRDSKTLSAKRRAALAEEILAMCEVGIGAASAAEIDRINIRNATHLAMRRALSRLVLPADVDIVVDGNEVADRNDPRMRALVRADSLVPEVSAASIVAKVCRDRLMARLALRYPGFGWERNAGYGTAQHRAGLARAGLTVHHRATFDIPGARPVTTAA